MSTINNIVLSALFDALEVVKNRSIQKSPLIGSFNTDEFSRNDDEIIKEAAAIASQTSEQTTKEAQTEPPEVTEIIATHDENAEVIEGGETVEEPERVITLLESVTHHITIPRIDSLELHPSREARSYPLMPLNLSEYGIDTQRNIFPITGSEYAKYTPDKEGVSRIYETLWARFLEEHNGIIGQSESRYSESLLYLMRKYMWCVPGEEPSSRVSLYDHARTTAAIAVSLSLYREGRKKKGPEFLIIQGELEGTRKFLFNPGINGTNLKVGSRLRIRGRSFYIELLVKTLSDYLVSRLGLHVANLLWTGGGRFTIIAPNTQKINKELNEIISTIDRSMLSRHLGELNAIITSMPVSVEQLRDVGLILDRMENDRRENLSRISPVLFENPDLFWESKASDIVCSETTLDLSGEDKLISDAYLEKLPIVTPNVANVANVTGGGTKYSRASIFYDATGRALTNCRSLHLFRSKEMPVDSQYVMALPGDTHEASRLRESNDNLLITFPEFDRAWLMSSSTVVRHNADLYLRLADGRNSDLDFVPRSTIARNTGDLSEPDTKTESTEALEPKIEQPACGFTFLSTTATSVVEVGDKSVNEATDSTYPNLVGVLHMDIDDFDYVHMAGLDREERSLAKTANLFNMFEWFFSGYLNALISKKDINIVTPGGDDIFLIGNKLSTLDAGEMISRHFYEFCGMNPDTHISGAYKVFPPSYPAGRAIEEIIGSIEIAKTERNRKVQGDSNKNAFVFADVKISWRKWREVKSIGDKILQARYERKILPAFIYNLNKLYDCYLGNQGGKYEDDSLEDTRWSAAFRYMVIQNVRDDRLRAEIIRSIERNRSYLLILASYLLMKHEES